VELHNVYSSPNTIKIMKSRRMSWAGYVALIRQKVHIGYLWESHNEYGQQEDKDLREWIILKWILER
jgi:hypothetical protein